MQDLHQQGFDVEALSQASITTEPLVSSRPAQALRYRLAVMAPPVQPAPHVQPGSTRTARQDEDHHLIHQPGHDRPGHVRR